MNHNSDSLSNPVDRAPKTAGAQDFSHNIVQSDVIRENTMTDLKVNSEAANGRDDNRFCYQSVTRDCAPSLCIGR